MFKISSLNFIRFFPRPPWGKGKKRMIQTTKFPISINFTNSLGKTIYPKIYPKITKKFTKQPET